jgi:pimeloyl-ACP methyl ester carboxylesterase
MRFPGKTGRLSRGFVFGLLAAVLVFAIVAWRNPLWLVDRGLDASLRFQGVRGKYITVDGHRIHYLVGGTGRPVVLIHGLGGRGVDWADLIPKLISGGHRVYAIDLLGYGLSDKPKDGDYSILNQALLVDHFLEQEHLPQVDLAGWSMGGWIAMRVALDHPDHVRRLVLFDSAGLRFKLDFDPAIFHPASPNDLAALEEFLMPHPQPLPGFLAMALLRRQVTIGWVVDRSVRSMLTGADLVDNQVGSLTMPVLIGWGEKDRLIPLTVGYKLHALIPQSVLDIYDDCGHLAPGKCAAQVAPSLVDFLNAQPARMAMVRNIPH